jgi:trehalose synthase
VGERLLEAYRGVAPDPILDQLQALAADLRGVRVLELNATPYGGGVSELLRSSVPLLNDLGLHADWKIISGDERFFGVTKAIHNGLQGAAKGLTSAERDLYLATTERNAGLLEEQYDVVVVHDPQPAGILRLRGKSGARWIWRCHIDTSEPNPEVWEFMRGYVDHYDAAVFTMEGFVPPDLPIPTVDIMPPAIDPLSPKNMRLADTTTGEVLGWIGVDLGHPLVTQVSRFDPWKDPLGVMAAYRLAREEVPDLQLALVGSMALDDPQGWEVYRQITAAASNDRLIHVFTNLTGVGNIEVNAFQHRSAVVVQKSVREGFGLVVSEAMWKQTPVVAGRAGGIPLQTGEGEGGVLVDGVEECATGIVRLLRDPDAAAAMAERGRERVRQHFLLPRLLLNEVSLIAELLGRRRVGEPGGILRDPVCGLALGDGAGRPTLELEGTAHVFCSDACRARFIARSTQRAGGGTADGDRRHG